MYFKNHCMHCGTCIQTCPKSAITVDSEMQIKIDRIVCDLCGRCVKSCPTSSMNISGKYMTSGEILEIVEEDKELYLLSGGGVTLSGGEPLFHDGIIDLLKQMKQRKIHVVIETAGNVLPEIMIEAVKYTDLFLYDIKIWDDMKHREYCKCTNKRIIENLHVLKNENANVQVRIPVIPTINDDENEIIHIVENIKKIGFCIPELLIFNTFGAFKYDALDRIYQFINTKKITPEKMDFFKNIVADVF